MAFQGLLLGKEVFVFTGNQRLAELFRAFGPGWLVMIADVDAASIITAAETGALYHYGLIWLLLLLIVPLFFIQEASGRIGVVTHKGLGEIVRENYSRNTALIAAVPMAITDVLTYVAEYVGIAIGMGLFGIPPIVSVPVAYLLHVLLVYRRGYLVVEKIMLGISAVLLLSYIASLLIKEEELFPILLLACPVLSVPCCCKCGSSRNAFHAILPGLSNRRKEECNSQILQNRNTGWCNRK